MRLPAAILDLAEQQLGVFARRQLARLESSDRVDDLLRHASVERVQRGVYAFRGGAVHRHRAAVAAALRVGPNAVVSGPAALELAGPDGLVLDRRYAIRVPRGTRVIGVALPLLPGEAPSVVARLGEIEVAGTTDAFLDTIRLAGDLPPRRLRLAHDQLRWAGMLRPGELRARATELELPEHVLAHELLAVDGVAATGDGERALGRLFRRFSPSPEPQAWVTPQRCVDWYFRTVRTAVEYQGVVDHAGETGRAADGRREQELRRAGIHVLYVTAADLADEPVLLTSIAGALAGRALELRTDAPRLRGG